MRVDCLLDSPTDIARHGRDSSIAISGIYSIGLARESWQVLGYGALRRAVFSEEQRLFVGSDLDEHDRYATPIVAVSKAAGMAVDVVGTVRIYQTQPGHWIGSRLAVDQDWRGLPVAAHLIRAAVCTATQRGCDTSHACVQIQNVPLFRRLRWRSLGEESLCGKLHHRMQADLNYYSPGGPFGLSAEDRV